MKKATLICICVLAVCSAAGFALTPTEAPMNLRAILSKPTLSPAIGGACATSLERTIFAAKPSPAGAQGTGVQKNICQANCGSGSPVSCSGTGSCTAADQNCQLAQQGHVTCGTTTIWCAPCECTGTFWCCNCQETGDCFACCRCNAFSPKECTNLCYP